MCTTVMSFHLPIAATSHLADRFGPLHRQTAGVLWSLTEIPFPAPGLREGPVPTGGDLSCLLGRRYAPLAQYGDCEQMAVLAAGGPLEDRPEHRDWRVTQHLCQPAMRCLPSYWGASGLITIV